MSLFERGDFTATVRFNDVISGNNPRISETSAATLPDYTAAIADSGFPGILSLPERRRSQALDNYLRQVVDRDLPGAGYTARRPETLRRWLAAYGAASSTPTSYSRILDATTGRDGSQPSKDTTAHYRDLLSQIWVLDPVPAWNPVRNPLKAAQLAPAGGTLRVPGDVEHLLWFREQFPDDVVDFVVLYSGQYAYRRPDGIAVIPLVLFGS